MGHPIVFYFIFVSLLYTIKSNCIVLIVAIKCVKHITVNASGILNKEFRKIRISGTHSTFKSDKNICISPCISCNHIKWIFILRTYYSPSPSLLPISCVWSSWSLMCEIANHLNLIFRVIQPVKYHRRNQEKI